MKPKRANDAGVSVLEVLVVLGILAAIIAIVVPNVRLIGSSGSVAQILAAENDRLAKARHHALTSGEPQFVRLGESVLNCSDRARVGQKILPNGTSNAATYCVSVEENTVMVRLDPLLLRLISVEP